MQQEEGSGSEGCLQDGAVRGVGEEWYDGCRAYCVCQQNGEPLCIEIDCPNQFGLDVINPNCISWEQFDDFEAVAPACCPPVPTCLSDGSCHYKGQNFSNYDGLPESVTGCEQRCHCENEEVCCSLLRTALLNCDGAGAVPGRVLRGAGLPALLAEVSATQSHQDSKPGRN